MISRYRYLARGCPTCGAESGQPCRIGYGSKVHAARYLPDHIRQPMTSAAGVPRARAAGSVHVRPPAHGTHAGSGVLTQPAGAGPGTLSRPGRALTGAAARPLQEADAWQKLKAGWPELADRLRCWIETGPRCMPGRAS